MAFTQQQLTALEDAIAMGTLEVEYGDKKVRYRSLTEMMRIRDMMRRDIEKPQHARVVSFSKGLQ
ncbi:phage head-tail joining protein [Endozoicomonas sp. ALE010]